MTQFTRKFYWKSNGYNVTNTNCPGTLNCIGTCTSDPTNLTGQATGVMTYWGAGTWWVDCLTLNLDACTVGGVKAAFVEWAPAPGIPITMPIGTTQYSNDAYMMQLCTFNVADFNTYDKVVAYQNLMIQSGDKQDKENFDLIMLNFCTLQSTNCKTIGGLDQTACSYLRDTGQAGDLCRLWFASTNQANKDAIGQNYCSKYNTDECLCLNRSTNPIYLAAAVASPYQDCCWWIPCKNTNDYFVSTNETPCKSCPTTICDAIVENYDSKGVNIPNIQQYIDCPGIQNNNNNNNNGGGGTTFSIYPVVIVILLIVIVLVIPPFRAFIVGHVIISALVIVALLVGLGFYVFYTLS